MLTPLGLWCVQLKFNVSFQFGWPMWRWEWATEIIHYYQLLSHYQRIFFKTTTTITATNQSLWRCPCIWWVTFWVSNFILAFVYFNIKHQRVDSLGTTYLLSLRLPGCRQPFSSPYLDRLEVLSCFLLKLWPLVSFFSSCSLTFHTLVYLMPFWA